MMEQAKRLLALVLAVLLLLPPVRMPAAASEVEAAEPEATVQEATEPETNPEEQETAKPPKKALAVKSNAMDTATAIAVDQTLTAEVPEGGYAWFSFTPAEDGYYVFTSNADVDTYADLYDQDQEYLLSDDDGGINNNFSLAFAAVAGKTYYLGARTYGGGAATYEVTLSRSAVASVTVEPLKLIEGTCGHMMQSYDPDTDTHIPTYYRYYWWEYMTYTVTMKNGNTVSGEGTSFEYDGQWYSVDWYDKQDAGNVWTPGNTYASTISLMGATAQVNVTITESPVESVTVSPLSFVENSCGEWRNYYDENTQSQQQFYAYNWWDYMTYTVSFKDGTSNTYRGMGFEYDGRWFETAWNDVQNGYNQWTVGNTYETTISVMGVSAPVSVSITESPVASVAVNPITIPEGTNGGWRVYQSEDMEVEYYHYYWWEKLTYTVTFTDGSTQTGNDMRFDYNGQEFGISTSEEQNGLAPWTGGNTYTPTITLMGVTAPVSVTIEESPIAGITVAPLTFLEGTGGSWYTHHDGEIETRYYRYEWQRHLSYTVTMTDGSTLSGNGTYFYYDGQEYHINWFDDQSGPTPWTGGNTYAPTISLMGVTAPVSVIIEESPIESIKVDPVFMMEQSGGDFGYGYNPSTGDHDLQYYRYYWWNYLSYTVTMKNGDTIEGSGTGFYYNDQWFGLATNDQQSADAPWTAGNTYTVDVRLSTISVPVSVTIEESPVVSISVAPITVCESMDGDWSTSYNPDTGTQIRYFRYNWANKLSYTVTLNDGSTVSGSGTGFHYNGQYYNINYSDDQHAENPWLVGNTYYPTVTLMGVSTQVSVTVDSSPVASVSVQPIAIMENTGGYWSEDYNPQTGSYESYYRYSWYNSLRYTITMKDGSTVTGYGTSIYYNGRWYYGSSMDDQYVANPWQGGNTYYPTITLMGYTAQVPVTIEESPIVSVVADPITLTDGLNGSWTNGYNPETGKYDRLYFQFSWHSKVSYTVTLRDGSTIRCTDGSNLSYEGQWFGLTTNDEQSFQNAWTAGNTYTGTLSVAGITTTVDITIAESPVESVVFDPIEIPEGAGGYWDGSYGSEGIIRDSLYYRYTWQERLSYTVTFRDGTSIRRTGTGFYYDNQWYYAGCIDIQNVENPWTVGNTYTQAIGLGGVKTQVSVTIVPNKIQSVVFEDINLAEHANGEWRQGTNPETGETEEYYKYYWSDYMQYTVTMEDGSTVQGNGSSFQYNGEIFDLYDFDDQSVTKQLLVGNTYAFDVKLGNMALEVLVSVSDAMEADGYIYSVMNGTAVIADCTREDTVLTIPEKLGDYTVTGVLSLGQALDYAEEIVVPDSVTMTSHNAFTGWVPPLKKLTLGSGISNISLSQHYFSWNLEHIEVSKDNPLYTSVDGVVYDKDVTTMIVYPANKEDTHIIPDSVENIDILFNNPEYGGFPPIYEGVSIRTGAGLKDFVTVDGIVYSADMTKIYTCDRDVTGTYVMPDSVTEVLRYAFANSSLEDVTWSSKVTEIVYGAFCYNDNLKTIRIPSSVKSIGLHAFGDSYGVESVYIEDLAEWCEIEFVDNPLRWGADLYVNEELVTNLQIPEGVEKIPTSAFTGISATSLTLPETVHTIEYSAFSNSEIQSAVLPEGLKRIYDGAFYNSKLQSVVLPDSLTEMEWEVFANCTELESVHIGAGLKQIQGSAFAGAGLKSLVIPENIQSIGYAAFEFNPLQEVVFENENVEISYYAFLGCPLKEVNLPAAITSIPDGAFARSEAVSIKFPDSVTEIMYDSFAFSDNLISVVLPENLQNIDACAFQGSTRLSHVLYKGSADQWSALGVNSEELSNAALHVNALGNEVAVVDTCARIWHYCYVCQQWEYIEKTDSTHSIENGVCTVCGYTEGAEETEPEVPETEYIPTEPETTEPATEPEATQPPLGTPEAILEAAYALASGESLEGTFTLTGTISAVNTAYSSAYSNITVTMQVDGLENMPIQCYRMSGTGADQIGVGDTITVTGTITNYNGTVRFASGCSLDGWQNTGADENLTTPEEIVKAAYALESGKALEKEYSLTGVITAVNSAYNSTYGNITVTIQIGDMADMPIQCYRLKGAGAELIGVGDTITVTGSLKNYNGTVEFDSGCTLDSYVLAEPEATEPEVTEPTEPMPEYVTEVEVGKAYKMAMNKNGTMLYFNGATESESVNWRLATTSNEAEAVDVYLEQAENGYLLYFLSNGVKTYIHVYERTDGSAGAGKGTLELTTAVPVNTYSFDSAANTLVYAADADNAYYMGTYSTYTTFSVSNTSYITGDKAATIDVSQYPARLYESASEPIEPTEPVVTEPETTEPEIIEPSEPTEPETTEAENKQHVDLSALPKDKAQYEEDTRDLGNGVTVTVEDGYINGGIRLYHDTVNGHHSQATFHSERPIHSLYFRAGYKAGTLKVEGRKNNDAKPTRSVETVEEATEEWVVIEELAVTAEYADYTVDFDGDTYDAVRLSSTGGTQLRLQTVTMEYAAEEPEVTEPVPTEPEVTEPTEPEPTEPEPTVPTEPEPTEPEPTAPSEPVEPTEPTVPTEPSEPESSEPEASEPETVDPATCTHSYGDWVITKAPTFSASGRQQKTCSICGKVVTQAIMPAVATVEKWNISLVDDLQVNFHLLISQSIESTAKVKISLADETMTYNVKDLEKTEEGLYVVSVNLAATQMADDIVVFIMDKNQMGCYANYTVRQYADTVLADESLSAYHDIVKEMLNYGAAAQNYFNYGADAPANEGITGAGMAEIPEQASAPMSISGSAEGVSFYAASLIYRERITVRFYFKFSGDINACTFAVNGEKLIPGLKDGLYYVDVTGVTPERLDESIELTITDGAGSVLTVSYSPMNYIVRMNAKGSESLKALLKALYNYHLAAKAFYAAA